MRIDVSDRNACIGADGVILDHRLLVLRYAMVKLRPYHDIKINIRYDIAHRQWFSWMAWYSYLPYGIYSPHAIDIKWEEGVEAIVVLVVLVKKVNSVLLLVLFEIEMDHYIKHWTKYCSYGTYETIFIYIYIYIYQCNYSWIYQQSLCWYINALVCQYGVNDGSIVGLIVGSIVNTAGEMDVW